jgi:hypothetical protein
LGIIRLDCWNPATSGARYDEQVHSILAPKLNFLHNFRADVGMGAYHKSSLLQYLEKALAEYYARLPVNGASGVLTGIKFPIANGYVTLSNGMTEGL